MKNQNNKSLKKILLILLIGIFMVNMISALDFDNIKRVPDLKKDNSIDIGDRNIKYNKLWEKYRPVEIKNSFGFGKTNFKGALTEHTETCGINCNSTLEVKLNEKGVLIQDKRFLRELEDGSWEEDDVRDYQFSYWGDIDDYETQCETKTRKVSRMNNKTKVEEIVEEEYRVCEQVKIGSHKGWISFDVGDTFDAGNYQIKLDAEKRPSWTYDWQIKTQGKWLDEWAVWGNISAGDDAEVILNSPTDNSIDYDGSVTFNATANVTGGAYLTNMSLWTNESGDWELNKTKVNIIEDFENQNYDDWTRTQTGGSTSIVNEGIVEDYSIEIEVIGDTDHPTETQAYSYNIVNGTYNFWIKNNDVSDGFERGVSLSSGNTKGASTYARLEISEGTIDYRTDSVTEINLYNSPQDNHWYLFQIIPNENNNSVNFKVYDNDGTTKLGGVNGVSTGTDKLDNILLLSERTNSAVGPVSITIDKIFLESRSYPSTFTRTYTSGQNIEWNVQACDTDGACGFSTTNRTFSIDTIPPTIIINEPSETLDYGAIGNDETLNVTIGNTNLDSCWYNYNGTNQTFSCSSGVLASETFPLEDYGINHNITVYANDTLGNTNSEFRSWDYLIFDNGQTYEDSITEGDTSEFKINVTYNSEDYVLSGDLVYNGTSYAGSVSNSGNTSVISRNTTVPGVDTTTNMNFYWDLGITDVSGTTHINSSSYNQTVNIINMSETGSPETEAFINFTAYDEQTLEEINATIDVTFTYKTKGGTVESSYSSQDSTENNSQWSFALDPSDETYLLDTTLQVNADGYTNKYYNFENLEVTNDTTEFGLYLLNSSDSTSFIVRVKDSSYIPLEGVEVWTQRYYPEDNVWRTVEIAETNYEGETIKHFFTEDTHYRFKVYDEGSLLYTTDDTLIYCEETPCSVEIIIPEEFEDVLDDYTALDDLSSSISYDDTSRIVTFTYSDTSGNFTQGRFFVKRLNPGEPNINAVCNQTSSSATAVLECDLTGETNGTYVAKGYVTRNDGEKLVERTTITKEKSIVELVGVDGVLWSIFLLIGIMMLGVYRPSLGIVFGTGGVILLSFLNIISIPMTAIVAIAGIGIILLTEVKRQ